MKRRCQVRCRRLVMQLGVYNTCLREMPYHISAVAPFHCSSRHVHPCSQCGDAQGVSMHAAAARWV